MHAGRHYTLREVLAWTRRDLFVFALVGSVPPALAQLGVDVGFLPWPPVAVLGVAVAFVTGFKSNAAYGRVWEARQIWGAIVNASRTFALMARDFVAPDVDGVTLRRLLLRHIAWLTALRYQLREPRVWESANLKFNLEFQRRTFSVPERVGKLPDDLAPLLDPSELVNVLAKKNGASAILALQSEELRGCREQGRVSEFCYVELVRTLATLIDQQGRCERIKNFPYPRQFVTLNLAFVWLFIVLLPVGVATEVKRLGAGFIWLTVPITAAIAWVFHTMDRIGEATENPFEGSANDVPITAMSRAIEIDLRDLLCETELPEPHRPQGNILM